MSKKGDARIARALRDKLKQQEKSARLIERVKVDFVPRLGADPKSIFHMQMDWHCNCADRAESWSWGQPREWGEEAWTGIIEPKLKEFEKLQWKEIDKFTTPNGHKSHHSMDVEDIDDEPQTRITDLQIEHDGEIFRFRLGNRRRLWGFRSVNIFEVLWYDPTHMIYRLDPD